MNIRNALLKLAHNKKAKNYGTDNQKVSLHRNDNRRRKVERTGKYGSDKQRKNLGRRCNNSNL